MLASDQYALAIAALSALGADLAAKRANVLKTDANAGMDTGNDSRKHMEKSTSRSRRRNSPSVSTRTVSSRSSTHSRTKAERSKMKTKAKSGTSRASSSKGRSLGAEPKAKRIVVTVAPHPKPEKYVPPPRGTFRSSYARYLRSEVLGGLVSDIEGLVMPGSEPTLITDNGGPMEQQQPSSSSVQLQDVPKRPPVVAVTTPSGSKLTFEDLPTLALSEFDFFSASRSRATTVKESSPVWIRSPAAPAPPKVRRWFRDARAPLVGTVEDVEEQQESRRTRGRKGSETSNMC